MQRGYVALTLLCIACSKSAPEHPGHGDAALEAGPILVEERTISAGDVELFVRRRGPSSAKQSVVLLHGGPALSGRYMRALEDLATTDRAIISFDQRGAGASSSPKAAAFAMDDYVADVEAVRGAENASRVVLLAHSWGGLIAWAYTAKYMKNVEALLFIGALAPTKPPNDEARGRLLQKVASLQSAGKIPKPLPAPVGDDCMPAVLAVSPAYFHDPDVALPEDLRRTTCNQATSNATNEAVFFPGYDYSAALAYTGPVHIAFGESDPLGVALGQHIQAALNKTTASLQVIPEAGHSPWFEAKNTTHDGIASFLGQTPP